VAIPRRPGPNGEKSIVLGIRHWSQDFLIIYSFIFFFAVSMGPKIGGYPQMAQTKYRNNNRFRNPVLKPGFSSYSHGFITWLLAPGVFKMGGYPQMAKAKWWKHKRSCNRVLNSRYSSYLYVFITWFLVLGGSKIDCYLQMAPGK